MERAWPLLAADGRFDGFEHYAVDVHEGTALGERLASLLVEKRWLLQRHAAFAPALADEAERLPAPRVKCALEVFAALRREPS